MSADALLRQRLTRMLGRLGRQQLPAVERFLLAMPRSPLARQEHRPIVARVEQHPKSPGEARKKDWPRARRHESSGFGTYMVTAATLHARHASASEARLALLEQKLRELTPQQG